MTKRSIVAQLEGALLVSTDPFPYLMAVAFEAGSPLRALILLLTSPFLRFTDFGLRIMIFISTAGLPASNINAVARSVLHKLFLEDMRESAYRVFSGCLGKRYVVTRLPRIFVEPFLRSYLDVDCVIGTEMRMSSSGKWCLGLVSSKGVMTEAMAKNAIGESEEMVDVGLAGGRRDHPFLSLCREHHLISQTEKASPLPRTDYPQPLIFHDGRLVNLPTAFESAAITTWLPFSIPLSVLRLLNGILLPYALVPLACAAAGIVIRSTNNKTITSRSNSLYICSHRTLLDPVFISIALQRKLNAVTYSLSRLSELISPIPTARLTRDRARDDDTMRSLLRRGDLVVCPEGTTCREPYLLRFSPLFAEITRDFIPVAVEAEGSMFYGTTVRGFKWMDSFFFLMNPRPQYRMQFLDCDRNDDESSYEVANGVQSCIGQALGFECTTLTRKDKYRMLAGNDGVDLRFIRTSEN